MTSTALRLATLAALAATVTPAAAQAARPASAKVTCRPVAVATTHGGPIERGTHLSPIRNGRVLAIDPVTGSTRTVRFPARTGRWLRSTTDARFAEVGQAVGRRVVASRLAPDRSIACAGPSGARAFAADVASSTTTDTPLPAGGQEEVAGSTRNRLRPLENVPTSTEPPACTNTAVHPDGAKLHSHPTPTVWCFTGPGAWLNDANGMERRAGGAYFGDSDHRHWVLHNNALVAAAKRPAATASGQIIVGSAIAWRIAMPVALHYPATFKP